MTIYSQITGNKVKTYLIIFLFIAFISFFFFLVGKYFGNSESYFIIGFIFAVLSGFGSYFFSDKIVLAMSGAKPADKKNYFDFYTAVENMSIAAGIPMPKVYIIEDAALNAFATGRDPKHAVVAATTGLLATLNRGELEGVIAHEMSHIKNYDILVMAIVSVLVGTLIYATDWIMRGMFWGRGSSEDRRGGAIGLIIFIFVLILTPIIATLIQLAVSRRRELLADATGALLNRNPDALANALIKISGDQHVLARASNATAHLYICNPFQKKTKFTSFLAGLFSTHPPVDERIRLLREM